MRPRTDAAAVIFLRLVFENADFAAFLMAHNRRGDFGAFDQGSADLSDVAVGQHEDFGALKGGSFVGGEPVHQNLRAILHAVLLAANADNCEHYFMFPS